MTKKKVFATLLLIAIFYSKSFSQTLGNTYYYNGSSWGFSSNIFNDGTKVGVGTINPFGKFEVNSNSFDLTPATITRLDCPQSSVLDPSGNPVSPNCSLAQPYLIIRGQSASLNQMAFPPFYSLNPNNSYTTKLILDQNGNLGIGTGSPNAMLDVHCNSYNSLGLSVLGNGVQNTILANFQYTAGSSSGNNTLKFVPSLSAATMNPMVKNNDMGFFFTDNSGASGNNSSAGFVLAPQGTNDGIRISAAGNVGIGIADPAEKLVVNGMVCCKEIRVTLNSNPCQWPDYVFNKGYKLLPLHKLEQYVDSTQHLPGIPDANDIKNQGVEIGEMQRMQLQKIEELTLYLIEIKKVTEAQQKEIAALKEQLKSQRKNKD